jgi:uncharacterized membrane protein YdjX (TVP38/TMEM64 family)
LSPRTQKIAAITFVLAFLLVSYRFGIFAKFKDPAELTETLRALGPMGYLAFVLAYALLQPFGVPGTVFIFAAPLIWPWPIAYALSMTGTMAASVVGFSFARFVARDYAASKIPARFRTFEERLVARGFTTVFLMRLVLWMPPTLHAFFGVSRVTFSSHFWGSLAGYLLPLFLVSYFGERVYVTMRALPWQAWAALAALAIVIGAFAWLRPRRPR